MPMDILDQGKLLSWHYETPLYHACIKLFERSLSQYNQSL